MNAPLLELKNISVEYNGLPALSGVSLDIQKNDLVALMGPNGAGKSTILKAIFGLVPLRDGSILWQGKILAPIPHKLSEQGIVYVPQGKRVFPSLSVRENIAISLQGVSLHEYETRLKQAFDLFPVLKKKESKLAGHLSGGEQQMVALARGLVLSPRLLLLDEPTLGLAPKLVRELFEKIQDIHQELGIAMMVVEHNLRSLLDMATTAYVLDHGRIVAHEAACALRQEEVLERVVLGRI